ncbi:dihydropteroate synthase [Aliiglaciecola sp. LCG003]|uniref:dihydropteroate synthase n=1 Tax=Aliiglaciecola sp. LCG003 TaxID=3053655 RepID=UPI0025747D44|nr:dihydropteroate synthase [Aliiglaciecola sp. LCG003]WJG07809.1 dihydropteroate synthase [Aliiglaciecola sp. LCG003]
MYFKAKFLDLTSPKVMGILNVTPDSFSDGGQFNSFDNAMYQAEKMIQDGADFIDVGGESTRPGAAAVSLDLELERTIPIVEALHQRFDSVISIDTNKAAVMLEAVKAGAGLINDVCALQEEGALHAAYISGAAVCLMHMQGQPRTMQQTPQYSDVVTEVSSFLQVRAKACIEQGIDKDIILIDPGFGFGKTLQHNYQLLDKLEQLQALAFPMLIGMSRKSMIGDILNKAVEDRLSGSIAAATIALLKGARILRVHDVKETVDAVKIVSALSA